MALPRQKYTFAGAERVSFVCKTRRRRRGGERPSPRPEASPDVRARGGIEKNGLGLGHRGDSVSSFLWRPCCPRLPGSEGLFRARVRSGGGRGPRASGGAGARLSRGRQRRPGNGKREPGIGAAPGRTADPASRGVGQRPPLAPAPGPSAVQARRPTPPGALPGETLPRCPPGHRILLAERPRAEGKEGPCLVGPGSEGQRKASVRGAHLPEAKEGPCSGEWALLEA